MVRLPEFILFGVGLFLAVWGAWTLVNVMLNVSPDSEWPDWIGWTFGAVTLTLGVGGLISAGATYVRRKAR